MASQNLRFYDLERSQNSHQDNPPVNPFSFVENTIALNPHVEREPFRSNPVATDSLMSPDRKSKSSKLFRTLKPLPAVRPAHQSIKSAIDILAANNVGDYSTDFAARDQTAVQSFHPATQCNSYTSEPSEYRNVGETIQPFASIRSQLKYSTDIVWERAGRIMSPRSFFKRATQPRGPLVEAGVALRSETLERMAALESTLRIAAGGPPRLARGARTMARAMARANAYRLRYALISLILPCTKLLG